MTAFVRTDGGRKAEGFAEARDCTVRALSIVSGTSYAKAHEFLKSKGRKSGRGFSFVTLVGETYDAEVIRALPKPHCTVNTYIKQHPTGNYIIRVEGHVLAVKDGVIFDNLALEKIIRRHVKRIFYLEAA
jgi:hypothetical protein